MLHKLITCVILFQLWTNRWVTVGWFIVYLPFWEHYSHIQSCGKKNLDTGKNNKIVARLQESKSPYSVIFISFHWCKTSISQRKVDSSIFLSVAKSHKNIHFYKGMLIPSVLLQEVSCLVWISAVIQIISMKIAVSSCDYLDTKNQRGGLTTLVLFLS